MNDKCGTGNVQVPFGARFIHVKRCGSLRARSFLQDRAAAAPGQAVGKLHLDPTLGVATALSCPRSRGRTSVSAWGGTENRSLKVLEKKGFVAKEMAYLIGFFSTSLFPINLNMVILNLIQTERQNASLGHKPSRLSRILKAK